METKKESEPPFNATMIWIDRQRDNLYKAIDARVDKMVEMGLLEEVKGLIEMGLGSNTM